MSWTKCNDNVCTDASDSRVYKDTRVLPSGQNETGAVDSIAPTLLVHTRTDAKPSAMKLASIAEVLTDGAARGEAKHSLDYPESRQRKTKSTRKSPKGLVTRVLCKNFVNHFKTDF